MIDERGLPAFVGSLGARRFREIVRPWPAARLLAADGQGGTGAIASSGGALVIRHTRPYGDGAAFGCGTGVFICDLTFGGMRTVGNIVVCRRAAPTGQLCEFRHSGFATREPEAAGRRIVVAIGDREGALSGKAEIGKFDPLPALLAATARGDRKAFRQLYQLSSPRLFAVALRLLCRRDLAEDILQDTYVAIWRKAGQYRPERGEPLAWMCRIVRNRAIDRLRIEAQPRDMSSLDDVPERALADTRSGLSRPDRAGASLRGCLEKLKVDQRRSIVLAYYYGMTHDELAEHLKVPLGTVKSWIRRGLMQLKDQLG